VDLEDLTGSPVVDDVQASLEETLRLLRRRVPIAEGLAMAFDPDVLLPIEFAATDPIDPQRALVACRNEQQDEDVFKFRDLACAELPIATLSLDTDSDCQTSIRWQELNVPRGRRQELRAVMLDPRGVCWGALALYRHDRAPFSPSDIEKVRRLLPERATHLALSMVASRVPGIPAEATMLLISEAGAVIAAPERAIRWLDEVRCLDCLDRVGMLLASIAARLRTAARRDAERLGVRVRMRSSGGAWTTLLAEPLAGDALHGISVVVMPTDSGQLLPLLVAAYGLSAREGDVVDQVLEGLDTKAIADQLCISVNTVQDHLKSVFDKTGVRSRRELAFVFTREPPPASPRGG
jgi:DNA-binding CsgD family transcriptional regulator